MLPKNEKRDNMSKIRIGIVGYGNLGKGAELAVAAAQDMELVGVFTRRDPKDVCVATEGVPAYTIEDAFTMTDKIDVMLLCGGSATDLPEQGPQFAAHFNTIDSFDTHAHVPAFYDAMDSVLKASGKLGIISVGWDPGMFSINRVYAESILPTSECYTFWGKGVSQGHSDAIRRIDGVLDAKQYTLPIEKALDAVRSGSNPTLSTREKHLRDCYVVAKEGADLAAIETAIKTMPNYFADYDTTVTFISAETMKEEHDSMPHGGFVIGSEKANGNVSTIEYSLKLDSNPEFTSKVLVAYARAAYRLHKEGTVGAKTVLDIAPALLSPLSPEVLRATKL